MLLVIVAASRAVPTTRSSEKALDDAVKKLTREFEKSKDASDLREQSNFFTPVTAESISAETLLEAMAEPIDRDPRLQSYVKWQLLSAVPNGFQGKSVIKALVIYRKAPDFYPRPGISDEDRARLDEMLKGASKDDLYGLTKALEADVAKNAAANELMLSYRDEMYRRLPRTYESLMAAFEDVYERFQAGQEMKPALETLIIDTTAWAESNDSKPKELLSMAEAIDRMLLEDGPQYYDKAEQNEGRLEWHKTRATIRRGKKLRELPQLLRDKAAQPKEELKFKDE
jgi:phosphoenolpyruvate carboxylase